MVTGEVVTCFFIPGCARYHGKLEDEGAEADTGKKELKGVQRPLQTHCFLYSKIWKGLQAEFWISDIGFNNGTTLTLN